MIRGAIVFAAFFPVALLFDRNDVFAFLNAMVMCMGVAVLIAYSPAIFDALRKSRGLTRAHYLVLGIACVQLAIMGRSAILWYWRFHREPDHPEELIDTIWFAFLFYLFLTGGALHLAAHEHLEDAWPMPARYWVRLGIIVGLALGMVYLVLVLTTLGFRAGLGVEVGRLLPR
jgi:nitrate reductase gamma subunit